MGLCHKNLHSSRVMALQNAVKKYDEFCKTHVNYDERGGLPAGITVSTGFCMTDFFGHKSYNSSNAT